MATNPYDKRNPLTLEDNPRGPISPRKPETPTSIVKIVVKELSPETEELRIQVKKWQQEYNTERPHQALGYLTPDEFYDKVSSSP